MNTVGICVLTEQTRDISTFSIKMFLDTVLQLGTPMLQMVSLYADFWTFLSSEIDASLEGRFFVMGRI
jgi:hypothetical protein